MICGTVNATENSAVLSGVPIELRDQRGILVATKKTDNNGFYSFGPGDGLVAGKTYFVLPLTNKTESSNPFQYAANNLTLVGVRADFSIMGWPATVQVSGVTPGDVVLISTQTYNGSSPPKMNAGIWHTSSYYAATLGYNDGVTMQVPAGNYYLTCWAGSTTNNNRYSSSSSGPFSVAPNNSYSQVCQ
jgi:hypothetical protein